MTIPYNLTRNFVRANPTVLFIAEMTQTRIKHCAPQRELEGLRNVFWIPTKVKCCMDTSAFFRDTTLLDAYTDLLEATYKPEFLLYYHVRYQQVVPDPMLGATDWSGSLKRYSPKCYQVLRTFVESIQTPHEINYTP